MDSPKNNSKVTEEDAKFREREMKGREAVFEELAVLTREMMGLENLSRAVQM